MLGTDPQEHNNKCPYVSWYNDNARWQPRGPLSEVAREVMVELACTCATQKVVQSDSATPWTCECGYRNNGFHKVCGRCKTPRKPPN